jgi:nitric oxide reductase activation protein
MEVAMKSTMALMSTFDNIKGVSSAASMFPGVTRLTDFHENVAQTKHRYVPSTLGTTPLGEALLWLIKDMANRRENRKMVIVLTDGAPNDPVICQKLIKRMEKFDIEVIGIGIETMAVEGLFPTSAVINQVKELPHKLFSLIQEKLVQ